jgi:hypothetical protein
MSTEQPDDLLKLWTLEKISVEMAIGHIMQNLVKQQQTVKDHDRSLYRLRTDVDDLIAHTGVQPRPKGKSKTPSRN